MSIKLTIWGSLQVAVKFAYFGPTTMGSILIKRSIAQIKYLFLREAKFKNVSEP